MDWNIIERFKLVYSSDLSKEQKINEILDSFPMLREYLDDLTYLFEYPEEKLPIIKGVAVETNQIADKGIFTNVVITKMPMPPEPEIQKVIMRIAEYLDIFTCQRWGIYRLKENGKKEIVQENI